MQSTNIGESPVGFVLCCRARHSGAGKGVLDMQSPAQERGANGSLELPGAWRGCGQGVLLRLRCQSGGADVSRRTGNRSIGVRGRAVPGDGHCRCCNPRRWGGGNLWPLWHPCIEFRASQEHTTRERGGGMLLVSSWPHAAASRATQLHFEHGDLARRCCRSGPLVVDGCLPDMGRRGGGAAARPQERRQPRSDLPDGQAVAVSSLRDKL